MLDKVHSIRPGSAESDMPSMIAAAFSRAAALVGLNTPGFHQLDVDMSQALLESVARLVINLPADDARVVAIWRGRERLQPLDDARREYRPPPGSQQELIISLLATPGWSVQPPDAEVLLAELAIAAMEDVAALELAQQRQANDRATRAENRVSELEPLQAQVVQLEETVAALRAELQQAGAAIAARDEQLALLSAAGKDNAARAAEKPKPATSRRTAAAKEPA